MTSRAGIIVQNESKYLTLNTSKTLLNITNKVLSNKVDVKKNEDWFAKLCHWADENNIDELHCVEKGFNKQYNRRCRRQLSWS